MFVGRERERARIDRLLQEARAGKSGALLLHGEAGIGKTALMRWAIGQATGLRVLRARGIETESDIPFAGLAELVTPLLDRVDDIPEVQARALRGALALGPATPHDRFTVPAGLLSLLAVAAEEQPVLVAIDDAQWLDEPSLEAFLFAGRRVGAEGIALLGALREGTAVAALEVPWLERLRIAPLGEAEARELLAASQLDRMVQTVDRPARPDRGGQPARAAGDPAPALRRPARGPRAARGAAAARHGHRARVPAGARRPRRGGRPRAPARRQRAHGPRRRHRARAARGRSDDRRPRARRGGAADRDRRRRRRVPPSAAALDRLPRRRRRRAPRRARRAGRRRARSAARSAPGTSPRAPSRPTRRSRRRWRRAALDARGRGAHATAARDFGRAAQLTPDDEPRARRLLEAATDATRSGEAEHALSRCSRDAARLATDPLLAADVQRMTGHVEMRRGSPLVAYELLVAEAERVRSRDPRRAAGMFLEASVSHMMTGDMHALVATAERARALATVGRPRRRAAGHRGDRRGVPGARRRRAGRRAPERDRAVPARGRPAGDRRGRRHGRALVGLDREVRARRADLRPR